MKITKQHRECFKAAIKELPKAGWICTAIDWTDFTPDIQKECKNILYKYFQDDPCRAVLWLSVLDGLSQEELLTCRLIALYTLIYAPL